jgi:5S rRNA maturation endonuclease (ribonuclease M5)
MGIKFDGNEIGFNCFNCSIKARYDLNDGRISKTLRKILHDFGIVDSEINQVVGSSFFNKSANDENVSIAEIKKVNTFTPEVELPANSRRLLETDTKFVEYLDRRKIVIEHYPFYISTHPRYNNRLIIPFYRQGKIIFWQARTIEDIQPRYLNCEVPRAAVIFNYDRLFHNADLPLFVVEGVFDAIHLNGIALAGSGLTEAKIEILKKTRRDLIFVIDQDANGKKLAEKIIDLEMGSITFAPNKLDVNQSIIQNGKLWTLHELLKNKTTDKRQLQLKLNFMTKNF